MVDRTPINVESLFLRVPQLGVCTGKRRARSRASRPGAVVLLGDAPGEGRWNHWGIVQLPVESSFAPPAAKRPPFETQEDKQVSCADGRPPHRRRFTLRA